MAIRKFTNPRNYDLSPGLQDVLRRNGIEAHISLNRFGQPELIVMGHDSPVLNYKLTDRQVEHLMDWGSNYHNKKAYDTFTSIVKNDFDMPQGFVVARNAYGRVAMGLHGYRIGVGEYGYRGIPFFRPPHRGGRGWFGDFFGFAPRYQDGWHLRRIGDRVFHGGPMTPERPDGRIKPGEMRSGSYGFYYKGNRREASQDTIDQVIADPKIKILQAPERPKGQAKPLTDMMTTDLYFKKGDWQEVLQSHGLHIRKEPNGNNMVLMVQSAATKRDVYYHLQPEELAKLTAEKLTGTNGASIDERLAIINKVIEKDFKDKVTLDMLKSKDMITVDFKPEVKAELEADYIEQERLLAEQKEIAEQNKRYEEARREEMNRLNQEEARIRQDPNAISGRTIGELMPGKGFFNSIDGGREAVVAEIRVDKTRGGNYVMSAVINGERVTHGITEKDYDKFLALDDEHRLKFFDKKFDEVVIHRGDGRGGDDIYMQNGYTRNPSALTGVFIQKEPNREEIIDFVKNASIGTFLTTGAGQLAAAEGIRVSNIEAYSVNELLARLSPEDLKDINKQQLADLNGKYILSARVDGKLLTHELTQEQYDGYKTLSKADQLRFFNETFGVSDGKTERIADQKTYITQEQLQIERALSNGVDGQSLQALNEKKGFYREGAHGREVEVGAITVDKDPQQEGKYKMTAVIDGKAISHEITQKDFDRFMAVDDMQRMKMFSKIFDEVDMKTRPGQGVNIGAAILAALVTATNVAGFIDGMAHSRPEIYESHMGGPHYYKPGVVHPAEVAAATYEAEVQQEVTRSGGIGRGV